MKKGEILVSIVIISVVVTGVGVDIWASTIFIISLIHYLHSNVLLVFHD